MDLWPTIIKCTCTSFHIKLLDSFRVILLNVKHTRKGTEVLPKTRPFARGNKHYNVVNVFPVSKKKHLLISQDLAVRISVGVEV